MGRQPRKSQSDSDQLPLDFESTSRERHTMLISALTITGTRNQERLALLVLWYFERRGDTLGETCEQIAERLGKARRTIVYWMRRLEAAGILRVEERRRHRGGCRSSLLSIDWESVQNIAVHRHAPLQGNRAAKIAHRAAIPAHRAAKIAAPIRNTLPCIHPILSSSSGSSVATVPDQGEVEEEGFQRLVAECRERFGTSTPRDLVLALREALGRGCTLAQLWERCRWFHRYRSDWADQHRPGALCRGIEIATPDLPVNQGWPYGRGRK